MSYMMATNSHLVCAVPVPAQMAFFPSSHPTCPPAHLMNSIGVWVDTHMVLAKVSVIDAAGVKQVRAVIECLRQQMRELMSQGVLCYDHTWL